VSPVSRQMIAEQIVGAAARVGSAWAFGVPGGGSNLDIAGACDRHGIRFILTHTETAAALMAGVTGELTGAPGIALATRGPGAASAANGVANALLERAPMVLVTDCVTEEDRPRVSHQRFDQQAFFAPVALASTAVNGLDSSLAESAVDATLVQPPGPVHLDVDPSATHPARVSRTPSEQVIPGSLADVLANARHPVIVVGVGVVCLPPDQMASVTSVINDLAARSHVPVLTTYKARGVVPDGAEYTAGVITGATIERHVLHAADLIIGIGFDPVELLPTPWEYPAPLILTGEWALDDADFFGERLTATAVGPLQNLVETIASTLNSEWPEGAGRHFSLQLQEACRSGNRDTQMGMHPADVVEIVSDQVPSGAIATVDAGAHMLVAVPLFHVEDPHHMLVSSGYATMGFAVPAAIAASLVCPDRRVVAFTGDGGAGMVLGELETLARLGLPVVVVVFNDSLLSLIAVKQRPEDQGGPEIVNYATTDFAMVAQGCGMRSWRARSSGELKEAMALALEHQGPSLIDVVVDPSSYSQIYAALRE